MKPHTSFLVCTNHRTGSGMLCDFLWQTNLAGRPDEYFDPAVEKEYSREWDTRTHSQYLDRVLENGTSPNGIFGAKIMWRQIRFLNHKVSRALNNKSLNTHLLMQIMFPDLKYIWLRRRNKIRQAVSFWLRRKTGIFRWFDLEPAKYSNEPAFNFIEIHKLVQEFHKYEFCWLCYFRNNRINPLVVFYEDDLEYGPEEVVRRILLYLGVHISNGLKIQTKYKKQSSELSENLIRLYKETLKREGRALLWSI